MRKHHISVRDFLRLTDKYILTVDEGTTQCKCALWDSEGKMKYLSVREIGIIYGPQGEIEMNPSTILDTVRECIKETLNEADCVPSRLTGVGLTNQRETTVIWDKTTGMPIHNAIVWQDRRGETELGKLDNQARSMIKEITGLVPGPYFSVSKIRWMLENSIKSKRINDLLFGTVDTWIIWNMSRDHRFITDLSNASRTMIYDINHLEWSDTLAEFFHIPTEILPEVVMSAAPELALMDISGTQVPLNSVAGDQQASLFGHQAFQNGDSKCTYGTGSFVLRNTGNRAYLKPDLLTSIAWRIQGDNTVYCNEGSAFNTGSVIKWIRDSLGLIGTSGESEKAAMLSTPDHGLIFIPALSGLGAPYWLPAAKGSIFGITGRTSANDLVRSALESIAFRVRDIMESMKQVGEKRSTRIRVDGGPTSNGFLMQFQADILNMDIYRSTNSEMTSAGVAYMAGIVDGIWSYEDISGMNMYHDPIRPKMSMDEADVLYGNWKKAIDSVIRYYSR